LVKRNSETFIGDCWPGRVGWIDFLLKEARTWWGGLYSQYEYPENVHVWNDMNEAAVWESMEGTLPKDAVQLNGTVEVREVHALYGASNAAATQAGLLAKFPNRRPFILTRSFFAGSQKFTWHWSGDNSASYEHLVLSLNTLLASNLAGMPFTGSDIGGFGGDVDPDLLARWHQLGAYLFPLCREHLANWVPRREPYLYQESNPDQFHAMLTAVTDRYKLLPLLYTAMRDASEFGQPFVAPVWFYFPRHSVDLQAAARQPIIAGKQMVVPQLVEGAKSVTVAKPPGNWFDLRSGAALSDGQTVPTGWSDHVPAFLRGGSVVALFNEHGMTVQQTYKKDLTLYVALNESGLATGALYFDDLVSMEHQNGAFTRVTIEFSATVLAVRPAGSYTAVPRASKVVVYGASKVPQFAIPGGTATLDAGVVIITGVDIDLSSAQEFTVPTDTPGNEGLSAGAVVGIVIGGLIGVILIVALASVVVARSRRTKTQEQKSEKTAPLLQSA
jgi:alpha 1,3-glucosidase